MSSDKPPRSIVHLPSAGLISGSNKPLGTAGGGGLPSAWSDAKWPFSAGRYVFLGEAILQLGEVKLGTSMKTAGPYVRTPIAEFIVRACAGGELLSFARLKSGGDPEPLPPGRWFTERWQEMVESCAIEDDVRDDAWLFVDRAGLEAMLRPAQSVTNSNVPLPSSLRSIASDPVKLRQAISRINIKYQQSPPVKSVARELARATLLENASDKEVDRVTEVIRQAMIAQSVDTPFLARLARNL